MPRNWLISRIGGRLENPRVAGSIPALGTTSTAKQLNSLLQSFEAVERQGDLVRTMDGLASEAAIPKTVMIDAAYLKAHRTAISLRSKKRDPATRKAV